MFGFFKFFLFTLHRSHFTVILGAVILNLALFSPCTASQAVLGDGAVQKGTPAKPGQVVASPSTVQNNTVNGGVLNILVDRIEGGAIYSRDGEKYEITGSTRVIDNSGSHPGKRGRAAELFFSNGSLESLILK